MRKKYGCTFLRSIIIVCALLSKYILSKDIVHLQPELIWNNIDIWGMMGPAICPSVHLYISFLLRWQLQFPCWYHSSIQSNTGNYDYKTMAHLFFTAKSELLNFCWIIESSDFIIVAASVLSSHRPAGPVNMHTVKYINSGSAYAQFIIC